MREWLRSHSPTVGAFLALVAVAGALSVAMPVPTLAQDGGSPLPVDAIPLPGPGQDADGDSYADPDDLVAGDLHVVVRLTHVHLADDDDKPYVLLGTQDDHWRTGAGAELEWRHVIDPDPLGHKPGSPAWQDDVLRTGAWWLSRPGPGEALGLGPTGTMPDDGGLAVPWSQELWANVRDDHAVVTLVLELRDAATRPHARLGTWTLDVDVPAGRARLAGQAWAPLPAAFEVAGTDARMSFSVDLGTGPSPDEAAAIAARWAPTLRFDSQELFVPVRGDLLERFHGFTRPASGDLRTWDFGFDAGRDQYRLFLADFNGDRDTDHLDAQVMADLLGAGAQGAPTVYTVVAPATDGQVVVQYWFLYIFNFVLDPSGRGIDVLQHKGDREFVQLTFPSLQAARNGTPSAVAFSQHYEGLVVTEPRLDAAPFEEGRLVVHVARGSHANFPIAGDDRRLRSSVTSLFDRFDGLGRELGPEDYALEALAAQPWHAGYKWGPVTRYTRDLGTSSQPLLQHDFRYPFTDPVAWQASVHEAGPDELASLYGGPA